MSLMKNIRLFIILISALSLYHSQALACSCFDWSSAQQTAQQPNVIVAKVQTLNLAPTGIGDLVIEKVYKGTLNKSELQIQGQDGANCAGEILNERNTSWVALFFPNESGYHMATCADAALRMQPSESGEDQFLVHFGQDTLLLNEEEFIDVIEYNVQPSIKGATCQLTASRSYVSTDVDNKTKYNYSYRKLIQFRGSLPWDKEIVDDLSQTASGLGILKFSVHAEQSESSIFKFDMNLTEPFFQKQKSLSSSIDLRKSYRVEFLGISRYVGLDGEEKTNFGDEPFLAHHTGAECWLEIGAPLIPVN